MSTRGTWAEALPGFGVALVIGAGVIYAGGVLGDAPRAALRLLAKGLWVLGLAVIGRAARQLLGEVAPGRMATWKAWRAGRPGEATAAVVVTLFFLCGTVFSTGLALDEHFLGAGGHLDNPTRALLLVLAACSAAAAGFAGWYLARVLRTPAVCAVTPRSPHRRPE